MITKVIELNTNDGTIVQSIADGIVAADAKVDAVKSALEARITGDVGVVQSEVTGVAALVRDNAAAILSARSDLTTKIDADLVAQALAIASETDVKVETAKTALEALITSNDGEITVLSAGQITLAAEIQANLASIGGEVLAREAEDVQNGFTGVSYFGAQYCRLRSFFGRKTSISSRFWAKTCHFRCFEEQKAKF